MIPKGGKLLTKVNINLSHSKQTILDCLKAEKKIIKGKEKQQQNKNKKKQKNGTMHGRASSGSPKKGEKKVDVRRSCGRR